MIVVLHFTICVKLETSDLQFFMNLSEKYCESRCNFMWNHLNYVNRTNWNSHHRTFVVKRDSVKR